MAQHRMPLYDIRDSLIRSDRPAKAINFGIEPQHVPDPYGFVDSNAALFETLATDLDGCQQQAYDWGKRLEIVVRFASEMNDHSPSQPWGPQPGQDRAQHEAAFKDSFRRVRTIFRERAPRVRFTFSPILHPGIQEPDYALIKDYWPGDGEVDVVSCTWYARNEDGLEHVIGLLKRYWADWAGKGHPFGIDEMGGCVGASPHGADNDRMIQRMLAVLDAPGRPDVRYDYVTLFLDAEWGTDATLSFLRDPA